MASFSACLQVSGYSFPLLHCSYQTTQDTDWIGRVITKVRYQPITLLLDVPDHSFLLSWVSDPRKQLAVDIVFLDTATRQAVETVSLAGAYCISYQETFHSGDTSTGACRCRITLSDPTGFTIHAGSSAKTFTNQATTLPLPLPMTAAVPELLEELAPLAETVLSAPVAFVGAMLLPFPAGKPGNEIHLPTVYYTPPPAVLPGFPTAQRVRSKSRRARWQVGDEILEWDSQHGEVEVYNKRGKHKGAYDPDTGELLKPAEKGRTIEP